MVGYTNAGKSTLFNTLTGGGVLAEDLLFATLDPTMREVKLPGFDKAILSDTVGFVSDLPTELIAAFRATLEEVASADLLIHVRDMSHPDRDAQREDVEDVLSSLGLDEDGPERMEAWNKVDCLEGAERDAILAEAERKEDIVAISALSGFGIEALRECVAVKLRSGTQVHQIRLGAGEGSKMAWLHARGDVLEQEVDGNDMTLSVRLSPDNWERFQSLQSA